MIRRAIETLEEWEAETRAFEALRSEIERDLRRARFFAMLHYARRLKAEGMSIPLVNARSPR